MTVEYHPAVEHELAAVRDYYEQQLPGLEESSSMSSRGRCFGSLRHPVGGWSLPGISVDH